MTQNAEAAIKKLRDPEIQKRALLAARTAITAQLKADGIEITPEVASQLFAPGSKSPDDVIAGAIAAIMGGIAFSDSRLKENVIRTGISPSGLNIYEFSYLGAEGRWRGVIAQELLKSNPEVVCKNEEGFLMVDYSRIDVDLRCLA